MYALGPLRKNDILLVAVRTVDVTVLTATSRMSLGL